jgi:hypothetical protein
MYSIFVYIILQFSIDVRRRVVVHMDISVHHMVSKTPIDILSPEGTQLFETCGDIIHPGDDGIVYDPSSRFDSELDLSQGTPRFYIMRLKNRGLGFDRITFHSNVTQCLSSSDIPEWFLGVSKPSYDVNKYPDLEKDVVVFRIPRGVIVKLHKGTWHAGPLFVQPQGEFFNLELADTNVTDHNTHIYQDTMCTLHME